MMEHIEERIIEPYNPSSNTILHKDRYNLFAPVADINKVGMAGYSADDFIVRDQIVSLKNKSPVTAVSSTMVEVDFSKVSPISLGVYDNTVKHFFQVFALTTEGQEVLSRVEAETALIYDPSNGELYLAYGVSRPLTADLLVVDSLLDSEQLNRGILVTTPRQAVTELYSPDKSYNTGELFLLLRSMGTQAVGVTTVSHGPEPFNTNHNIILTSQVYEDGVFRDLEDVIAEYRHEFAIRADIRLSEENPKPRTIYFNIKELN